ncbi:unnamed protein product, partial [Prorocentrum cordatum]
GRRRPAFAGWRSGAGDGRGIVVRVLVVPGSSATFLPSLIPPLSMSVGSGPGGWVPWTHHSRPDGLLRHGGLEDRRCRRSPAGLHRARGLARAGCSRLRRRGTGRERAAGSSSLAGAARQWAVARFGAAVRHRVWYGQHGRRGGRFGRDVDGPPSRQGGDAGLQSGFAQKFADGEGEEADHPPRDLQGHAQSRAQALDEKVQPGGQTERAREMDEEHGLREDEVQVHVQALHRRPQHDRSRPWDRGRGLVSFDPSLQPG